MSTHCTPKKNVRIEVKFKVAEEILWHPGSSYLDGMDSARSFLDVCIFARRPSSQEGRVRIGILPLCRSIELRGNTAGLRKSDLACRFVRHRRTLEDIFRTEARLPCRGTRPRGSKEGDCCGR